MMSLLVTSLFSLPLFFFPSSASAYLDPFTGSFLIQGLIAGGLTCLYVIKKKWQQLRAFFGKHSARENLEDMIDEKNTED